MSDTPADLGLSKEELIRKGMPPAGHSDWYWEEGSRHPGRPFHPTYVKAWTTDKAEIRAKVSSVLQALPESHGYRPVGFYACATHRCANDAIAHLNAAAGQRCNELLGRNGISEAFSINFPNPRIASQEEAALDSRLFYTAYRLDEHGRMVIPDVYAAPFEGGMQHINQASEVTIFPRVEQALQVPGHLITVWNCAVFGLDYLLHCPYAHRITESHKEICSDLDVQANVLGLLSQELRYMSLYNLHTGIVSCYHFTWPIKVQIEGEKCLMEIGDPIESTTNGSWDGSSVSVPETVLWSLSVGQNEPKGHSYRVAQRPGEKIRSLLEQEEFDRASARGAEEAILKEVASYRQDPITRSASGSCRHITLLHHCIGPKAMYGRWKGLEAVFKFGFTAEEKALVKAETSIYAAVKDLQGSRIAKVLEFVELPKETLCLVIGFIPGRQWDWKTDFDKAENLLAGLEKMHALDVVHQDLHPCNLRVSEDGIVYILSLNSAKITTNAREKAAEIKFIEQRVALGRKNATIRRRLAPIKPASQFALPSPNPK